MPPLLELGRRALFFFWRDADAASIAAATTGDHDGEATKAAITNFRGTNGS
jgi:hypothetical protein